MKRSLARVAQILLDLFCLSLAYGCAYLFRFEFSLDLNHVKLFFFTWPYVLLFQYLMIVAFGVHRFAWRYIGLRETSLILLAVATSTAVLTGLRLGLASVGGYALYLRIPLGVLAIDCVLAFFAATGVRVLRRLLSERQESRFRQRLSSKAPTATLLIGAGRAGLMVAKEIAGRPDLGIRPVGFLDDDASKHGSQIHGIRVLGTAEQLPQWAERTGAKQVLITMAAASGKQIRRIVGLCEHSSLPTKIVPGLFEIVGGRINLSRIRNVAIEDLLRREPVTLDCYAIAEVVRGRVVLVTGSGGSIGSELCRQVASFGPARLVLVERAENNLFQIHRELHEHYPDLALEPCLADIADQPRMAHLLSHWQPQVLFHAAAHKHVPMMEWNPGEAVKNNVIGTQKLADLADSQGVERFVMISTDKAVNPTSVMGASKRAAEMYVQALSQKSATRFITVRFGNVLGSAGSVVPIFQEQIARGGPVTITHPDMKRYFMTIPEACQLVLQAASMGRGGEIFILDMGDPVRILDLARDLIRLSGLRPDEDIEIRSVGIRPGEKLFEEIAVVEEHAEKTRHPKIYVGRFKPLERGPTLDRIRDLAASVDSLSHEQIRTRFQQIVPEYQPTP